jgi:hypothetical protein
LLQGLPTILSFASFSSEVPPPHGAECEVQGSETRTSKLSLAGTVEARLVKEMRKTIHPLRSGCMVLLWAIRICILSSFS